MTQKITAFPYGVEIIEGLPGAGKSYYAVRRVCKTIEETRRPVYTNLPLKWRVIRAYLALRGGSELASLIRPLKEKHWRSFLRRQHAYALFRESKGGRPPSQLEPEDLLELAKANEIEPARLKQQDRIHSKQMRNWFIEVFGPEVYEGNEADSIPLSAIIVIDEVQNWHPMDNQRNDKDGGHLRAYLSMCRHHLHWIWVITQDASRVNILFRLIAESVWRVRNRGEEKLAWGIRFKHLGLKGMGYDRYSRHQLEGRDPDDVKPSERFTVLPQRKKNAVFFRLYSSWTQAGSQRQILSMLRKARKEAGLTETGRTQQEIQQQEENNMSKTKKKPLYRRFITGTIKLTMVSALLVIAFAIGISINPKETHAPETTTEEQRIEWPKYNGITKTNPIFDGKVTSVGDKVGTSGELAYYNPRNRAAVIIADGGYWLWRYTEQQPRPVGEVGTVQAAYENWQRFGERTPQEVFGDAGPASDPAVETPGGDDIRD